MSDTLCEGCGQHSFLIPLHGGKGGPLRCPLCVGAWNAEHGRKRRTGRIVIRAMMAFLDAGGTSANLDELKTSAICGGDFLSFHIDPLGYMADIAHIDGADVDLTSELLADVLALTHPDHHPLERKALAHRVTQGLLALKPFVFPAPEPKLELELEPEPAWPTAEPESKPSPPRYPCADCADTVPHFYCDACKAEWEKRQHEEEERARAKQRAWYARRPKMWTPPRPPKGTPKPRTARQARVANQIPGSNLINHWLSGLQVAILRTAYRKRVPGARGCDVSHAELLTEVWGWEPAYELRWTEEAVKPHREGQEECLYQVGDTLPSSRTHGAFNHIKPYKRRAARASLSRALTRLEQHLLISFVDGTMGTYGGGLVLTPLGEQIARSLGAVERAPQAEAAE